MKLIKDLGMLLPKPDSKRKYRYGLYECPDCGCETKAQTTSVNRGQTKRCASCGGKVSASKQTREQKITHGGSGTRLHNIWNGMIDRCRRENHPMFKHYGGKGVVVCKEWLEFVPFREWSLTNGYEEHLTIERMNNDGNYEPSNCMWATRKEQSNNQTHSLLNRYSVKELKAIQQDYSTTKLSTEQFCLEVGISDASLFKLLNGGFENVPAITVSKKRHDNTSGFVGVTKSGDKWAARLNIDGNRVYLGLFDTPEKANNAIQERKNSAN